MFLHSSGAFFFWDGFLRFRCRCKLRGQVNQRRPLSLVSCRTVLPCVLNGLLMVGVHLAGFVTLRIREVHTNLTRHVVVRDGVAVRVVRHTEQGARERPVANGNQAGTALPQVLIPDFLRVVHAVNLAQARSVGGSHGLNVRVAVTRPAARPPDDARLHVVNLVAGALRPQLLDAACVPVNLLCRVELEVVVRVVVRTARAASACPQCHPPSSPWRSGRREPPPEPRRCTRS